MSERLRALLPFPGGPSALGVSHLVLESAYDLMTHFFSGVLCEAAEINIYLHMKEQGRGRIGVNRLAATCGSDDEGAAASR